MPSTGKLALFLSRLSCGPLGPIGSTEYGFRRFGVFTDYAMPAAEFARALEGDFRRQNSIEQVSGGRFLFGVGGAFPHAARRAVRYADDWASIAGRGPDGDVDQFLRGFTRCCPRPDAILDRCQSRFRRSGRCRPLAPLSR